MSGGWRVCILGGVLSFSLSIGSLVTAEHCQIYYLVIVQIPYRSLPFSVYSPNVLQPLFYISSEPSHKPSGILKASLTSFPPWYPWLWMIWIELVTLTAMKDPRS